MPTRRQERLNALLFEELSLLVPGDAEEGDLEGVSITRVETTQDLSTVKVYFRSDGDPDAARRGLAALEPDLRGELAELGLRRLPHLVFAHDRVFESGERVLKILDDLHDEAPQEARDPAAALEAAALRIAAARRVWLGTHVDPDGDAIGSLLGLGHLLAARGIEVRLACQDRPPREARALPGVETIGTEGPAGEDLAIALDAADAGRLGRLIDPERWGAQPTIVLDHHVSNPRFGDINVIDPGAAATAEIVVALADRLEIPISAAAAECLLTGLVTDTLGFRTTSTTERSLDCAGRLIRAGAPLAAICQRAFYSQPLATLSLTGRVMERLERFGPFALTWTTLEDLAATGAAAEDLGEITRWLATAEEPLAIGFLRERAAGGFDLSLRSKPGVDLVPAVLALGGGGHPQAAGAILPGPLEAAREALRRALTGSVRLPGAQAPEPD